MCPHKRRPGHTWEAGRILAEPVVLAGPVAEKRVGVFYIVEVTAAEGIRPGVTMHETVVDVRCFGTGIADDRHAGFGESKDAILNRGRRIVTPDVVVLIIHERAACDRKT
jgi:hypothetical protein